MGGNLIMFNTALKIYKKDKTAILPNFSTTDSACFDISTCFSSGTIVKFFGDKINLTHLIKENNLEINLPAKHRAIIPTGLILDIPKGYSVRIHPRSGLAIKHGIIISNCEGVIDSDYVDELMILITNQGHNDFTIKHGDRIAQGELVKSLDYKIIECYNAPGKKTNRNGGLGSTGV